MNETQIGAPGSVVATRSSLTETPNDVILAAVRINYFPLSRAR